MKTISFKMTISVVLLLLIISVGCRKKNRADIGDPFPDSDLTDPESSSDSDADLDDTIIFTFESNQIKDAYVDGDDNQNKLEGKVSSGVALTALSYALKQGDNFGEEHEITLGQNPTDFDFLIKFEPEVGTEAIRVTAFNGENTEVKELEIENLHRKLIKIEEITLTNEIGEDKMNWFSAWQEPHVFSVEGARDHQEKMDFAMISRSGTRFAPGILALASPTEKEGFAPYLKDFSKVTYDFLSGNRATINSITEEDLNDLVWDVDMFDFVDNHFINISTPYDLYGQNRRVSDEPTEGHIYMLGWGSYGQNSKAENKAFGIIHVTSTEDYQVDGVDYKRATFDVIVPAEDMRTKYKDTQTFDYNPD